MFQIFNFELLIQLVFHKLFFSNVTNKNGSKWVYVILIE